MVVVRLVAAVLLVLAVIGCGESEADEITGVVVDFEGDITTVERFVVRNESGDFEFVPADDLVFHGAPVGHIGEHQRTGIPVTVRYTTAGDGELVAEEVFDAG